MSLENIVYLFGLCFHGDNNYPESSIGEFGVNNYITYVKEFKPHDVPPVWLHLEPADLQ